MQGCILGAHAKALSRQGKSMLLALRLSGFAREMNSKPRAEAQRRRGAEPQSRRAAEIFLKSPEDLSPRSCSI